MFTGTLADVNAALDGLVFTPNTGFTGVAAIDIEVDDLGNSGAGGALTDSDHVDIVVGDAPLVDLDADDSSGADGAGFQTTFLVGAGAVSIADAVDALIEDPDDGNLASRDGHADQRAGWRLGGPRRQHRRDAHHRGAGGQHADPDRPGHPGQLPAGAAHGHL